MRSVNLYTNRTWYFHKNEVRNVTVHITFLSYHRERLNTYTNHKIRKKN